MHNTQGAKGQTPRERPLPRPERLCSWCRPTLMRDAGCSSIRMDSLISGGPLHPQYRRNSVPQNGNQVRLQLESPRRRNKRRPNCTVANIQPHAHDSDSWSHVHAPAHAHDRAVHAQAHNATRKCEQGRRPGTGARGRNWRLLPWPRLVRHHSTLPRPRRVIA